MSGQLSRKTWKVPLTQVMQQGELLCASDMSACTVFVDDGLYMGSGRYGSGLVV